MRRYIGRIVIGSATVAVIVASFAIWLTVDSPSEVDAAVLAQRAQAQSVALADQLLPGKVLHVKYEYYRRHGSAAARIEALPYGLPERFYTETWKEVNEIGNISAHRFITVDLAGNVYQRGSTQNGELVTEIVRANKEHRIPFTPYSAERWARNLPAFVNTLPAKGFHKVGEGIWDGKETAIFERRFEYHRPPWEEQGGEGFRIPYAEDLDAQEYLERFELVLENPLINRSQRWVVDSQGKKTLVEEEQTLLLEVIDSPEVLY